MFAEQGFQYNWYHQNQCFTCRACHCIITRWINILSIVSGCQQVSTINCESFEPSPATAALGGVPPAPSRTFYLQFLDLSDCTRLMDAGLRVIAKNSPHIQNLYLRRCVNITGNNNWYSYSIGIPTYFIGITRYFFGIPRYVIALGALLD